MSKRKLPMNKEKSKELKKMLVKARNNTERIRISIMVEYLKWKNTVQVSEWLWISHWTVCVALNKYINQWESNFYKTNYKWTIESEEHKEVKKEIEKMIKKSKNPMDINDIKKELNKQWKDYDYHKVRWFIRKRMNYNYQKPYVTNTKQSEHAGEIIEGRLSKAIYEIALEEREIDAEAIKNKKTKIWRD